MKLSAFVHESRCVVPLAGPSLRAAATDLLDRLAAAGVVQKAEVLRNRIGEERPEDIVAMGDRAFILHFRTDSVAELVVGLGTSLQPICREFTGQEQQCARVVVLIAAPPREAPRYLQVVGAFSKLLSGSEAVEAVLAQPDCQSLAALPQFDELTLPDQLVVRDIMTEFPRTVSPDTPIPVAAMDMIRSGVEGLPVVDSTGRLVGMLTERELLRFLLSNQLMTGTRPQGASATSVREVMTRQVLCVSADQSVAEVASLLSNKDIDRVPVVQDGRLVGVLTRGDIVRKIIGS